MYRVIVMDTTNISGVEAQLNVAAEDGYHYAGILQMSNRAVIIMEKDAEQPKRGRPRKIDLENNLGD